MKRLVSLLCVMAVFCLMFAGQLAAEDKVITMSTTTSTQASGLLDVLLPAFKAATGIDIKVVAKGTGAAIRDGQDGNVDVIFVHDTAREEQFVADGFGTKRYAVMHNDFVLLGPAADPAGIKGLKDGAEALKKIAEAKAFFVSRGDDSGTHGKEKELWKKTGLPLEEGVTPMVKQGKTVELKFERPVGDWYLSIGQGMDKTLTFADEKQGYTLSDRGTFINFKYGADKKLDLEVLVEGDPALFNPYGVIPVNPKKFPHVKYDLADQFAQWLVSPEGQALIANYKQLDRQLFYPDAIPDAK